jgi:serine/threonine protein kinase/Tfp pilus assembly protein PilF
MRCPACGQDFIGVRCHGCGATPGTVATGVLTPLPESDAATVAVVASASGPPFPDPRNRGAVDASQSAAGTLAPGHTLGTRYQIIRTIGEGGMGCVYQAWDAELAVVVALKVIRPEIATDPFAAAELERRFKRELLLARQVTHTNVVRIHDLGTIDGLKYITMSYVEGMNLGTVLTRDGKLPVSRALRIARGIVAGLTAAHQAGVVHRDLKPPNIMIDAQDEPLIMDFGVARSASPGPGVPSDLVTMPDATWPRQLGSVPSVAQQTTVGTVVGTIEYMAPEQARGEVVDHRADIYAFGLILYDMLAGNRRASHTGGPVAELTDRMAKTPAALRSFDATVPASVDAIVDRCLAPDAAARYQTTTELATALNRLDDEGKLLPVLRRYTTRQLAAASLLVLSLIGGTWWLARPPAPVAVPDPVSILIADFENRTNDPVFTGSLEQALGIAMEAASFVTAYPRADAVRVASQSGMGRELNERVAQLISRREGIKFVLAGAIDSSGSGYRITIRALDPALDLREAKPLASFTATAATKSEVLATTGSLASQLRGVLGDTTPESARLAAAETYTATSLDAMRAYGRGQELNRAGNSREALVALDEAIRIDPGFATAHFHMASIYWNLKMEGKAKASYDEAMKHLDRMTERERLRTVGSYFLTKARNYEKAIETYEELVRLYPSDNVGYSNIALASVYVGNVERAVAVGRKAIEIYPKNILQRTNYSTYSMYSGDFATAIAEAQRVLTENRAYEWANLTLALSTLAQGDEKGARDAYAHLASVGALGASLANMGEADLEMSRGRYATALEILQAGIASDGKAGFSSNLAQKLIASAEARLVLGHRPAAAAAAERAASLAQDESVLYPAARILVAAGQFDKAEAIAATMEASFQTRTRSYGRLVRGAVALQGKRYPEAVDAVRAGLKLHDSWTGRALLGEVYSAAALPAEALDEWELCVKRRGEATDAFFADTSTLRYLPPVYYWRARAQEALGAVAGARASYEQFLQFRANADPPDPLAADARRRLESLKP